MMSLKFQVPVHVVDSPQTWATAVAAHWRAFVEATRSTPESNAHLPVVGLDAEWVRKRPMAVLQVGSMHGCFLFQLQRCAESQGVSPDTIRQWLPEEVISFLTCDDVVKCGVNISGDMRRLEKEQGIFVRRHLELDHVALLLGLADVGGGQLGLGALSERILGIPLGKDINVTLSNWEADVLAPDQIQYAADDAIASALIACEIYRRSENVEGKEGVVAWSHEICERAMAAFKLAHKEMSRALNMSQPKRTAMQRAEARLQRKGLQRMQHEEDQYRVQSLEAKFLQNAEISSAAAGEVPASYTSVRVLSQEGHYIFSCDMRKADWYRKRNLADEVLPQAGDVCGAASDAVGEHTPQVRRTIRLTFDPKMKTKLCMHHQLGTCVVGEYCPYAHGPEELRSSAEAPAADAGAATATPLTRPLRNDDRCAICLSTSTSIKHAIVPPKLRKFLPRPFQCGTSDDFVLVCVQCNPRVRIVYDDVLKRLHEEACDVGGPDANVNMNEVKRVVGYAQILYAAVPRKSSAATTDGDEMGAESSSSAPPPASGGPHGTNKVPPSRLIEMAAYVHSHWRCSQLHLSHPHISPTGEEGAEEERHCAHDISTQFLETLVKVTPGDVRARATVRSLVGGDKEAAAAFVRRWRGVFVDNFKPAYCPWVRKSADGAEGIEPGQADSDGTH
jgi:ribonuclease D